MSDSPATLLDEAIESFGFARQGTISEAANIPDDKWDFRPHPDARSVSEIIHHMLQASLMLLGEAAHPQGDFTRRSPPEHVRAHAPDLQLTMSPVEMREALHTTHDAAVETLLAAGEDHMMTDIKRFDGGTWKRVTYVFYAASHEDYHRGQIAIYARTMGLVPALTQRIHGGAAK